MKKVNLDIDREDLAELILITTETRESIERDLSRTLSDRSRYILSRKFDTYCSIIATLSKAIKHTPAGGA
jgi:hypothetical protein